MLWQLVHAEVLDAHGGPQTLSMHSSRLSALAEVMYSKAIMTTNDKKNLNFGLK